MVIPEKQKSKTQIGTTEFPTVNNNIKSAEPILHFLSTFRVRIKTISVAAIECGAIDLSHSLAKEKANMKTIASDLTYHEYFSVIGSPIEHWMWGSLQQQHMNRTWLTSSSTMLNIEFYNRPSVDCLSLSFYKHLVIDFQRAVYIYCKPQSLHKLV